MMLVKAALQPWKTDGKENKRNNSTFDLSTPSKLFSKISLPLVSISIFPASSEFCAVCPWWLDCPDLCCRPKTAKVEEHKVASRDGAHLQWLVRQGQSGYSPELLPAGCDQPWCDTSSLWRTWAASHSADRWMVAAPKQRKAVTLTPQSSQGVLWKMDCCRCSPVCSSPCASSVPPPSFCTHFYIWDRSLCLWPQSGAANVPPGSLVDSTKDEKGMKRLWRSLHGGSEFPRSEKVAVVVFFLLVLNFAEQKWWLNLWQIKMTLVCRSHHIKTEKKNSERKISIFALLKCIALSVTCCMSPVHFTCRIAGRLLLDGEDEGLLLLARLLQQTLIDDVSIWTWNMRIVKRRRWRTECQH